MFYYCEKCADIKNAGAKAGQDVTCEVCGTAMKPVLQEYLMPGGSFFKSQAVRQQFISMIQSQETYDADIGGKKEELKEEAKAEEQRHIAEMNQKMQIIELEKRMKQNAVLRDKARAEEEFQEEKTKLDRALAMDVISRDEYNFKISIARKKVDNFEEIRKIEQQFDMGIITKEEKNAKIAALTQ